MLSFKYFLNGYCFSKSINYRLFNLFFNSFPSFLNSIYFQNFKVYPKFFIFSDKISSKLYFSTTFDRINEEYELFKLKDNEDERNKNLRFYNLKGANKLYPELEKTNFNDTNEDDDETKVCNQNSTIHFHSLDHCDYYTENDYSNLLSDNEGINIHPYASKRFNDSVNDDLSNENHPPSSEDFNECSSDESTEFESLHPSIIKKYPKNMHEKAKSETKILDFSINRHNEFYYIDNKNSSNEEYGRYVEHALKHYIDGLSPENHATPEIQFQDSKISDSQTFVNDGLSAEDCYSDNINEIHLSPAQKFLRDNGKRLLARAKNFYAENQTKLKKLNAENNDDDSFLKDENFHLFGDPVVRPPKNHLWNSTLDKNPHENCRIELEKGKMPTIEQLIKILEQEGMTDVVVVDLNSCGRRDIGMYAIVATAFASHQCCRVGRLLKKILQSLEIPFISKMTFCHAAKRDEYISVHSGPLHFHLLTEKLRTLYNLENLWLYPHEHFKPEEFPAYFDYTQGTPPPYLLRNINSSTTHIYDKRHIDTKIYDYFSDHSDYYSNTSSLQYRFHLPGNIYEENSEDYRKENLSVKSDDSRHQNKFSHGINLSEENIEKNIHQCTSDSIDNIDKNSNHEFNDNYQAELAVSKGSQCEKSDSTISFNKKKERCENLEKFEIQSSEINQDILIRSNESIDDCKSITRKKNGLIFEDPIEMNEEKKEMENSGSEIGYFCNRNKLDFLLSDDNLNYNGVPKGVFVDENYIEIDEKLLSDEHKWISNNDKEERSDDKVLNSYKDWFTWRKRLRKNNHMINKSMKPRQKKKKKDNEGIKEVDYA